MTNRTVQSLLDVVGERWGDCTANLSLFAARWCMSIEVRGKVVEYLTADTLADILASLEDTCGD